jgi:homopolymeric O-antigen transport system permease protein
MSGGHPADIVTAAGGRMSTPAKLAGRLRALWAYRGFVVGMVVRDFRGRYLGSVLGAFWALLNPVAQVLIYTVIFSQVMRARLPHVDDSLGYSLYLCAGILTWGYFVEVLLRSQTVFLEQANMLKKVNFPRVTLPVYVFLSASVNFLIVWTLFLGFLLVSGRWPGRVLIALVPLLVVQQVLAVGLGLTLGVTNVFFRDVAQAVGVGLQFWFWLTPIVYPLGAVPEIVRGPMAWNPLYGLVGSYQRIVVEQQWPVWSQLWPVVVVAVLFAMIAESVFRRLAPAMVDEL